MDFLFAPLPTNNFQMTTEQLRLWQRNAIFECECDNFINHRIETGRVRRLPDVPNLLRRPYVEQTAIDAAIQQHGLGLRAEGNSGGSSNSNSSGSSNSNSSGSSNSSGISNGSSSSSAGSSSSSSSSTSNRGNDDPRQMGANVSLAPLRQRPRLMALSADQERDNMLDNFYQEAINTAFRMRGLGLMRNP